MQLSPVVMTVPRFTTSQSDTLITDSAVGVTLTFASVHLATVNLSSAPVSAMLPPSARNMPYFWSALAMVRAPSLGRVLRSKLDLSRKCTPYGGASAAPEVAEVVCVPGCTYVPARMRLLGRMKRSA